MSFFCGSQQTGVFRLLTLVTPMGISCVKFGNNERVRFTNYHFAFSSFQV